MAALGREIEMQRELKESLENKLCVATQEISKLREENFAIMK